MQSETVPNTTPPADGPAPPLRVIVAADTTGRGSWVQALAALGHQTCEARTAAQLAEQCRLLRPDLVIADPELPGFDEVAAPGEADGEGHVPVLLVAARPDVGAVERLAAWDLAGYLTEPVAPGAWAPALAVAVGSFRRSQALRGDLAALRRQLDARRDAERAKGVVMRRLAVDEEEAYRRMQRFASKHNRKLGELAKQILKADEVFRSLETI